MDKGIFLDVKYCTLHPPSFTYINYNLVARYYICYHGILICREYFQLNGIIKGVIQHHQQSPIPRHTIHTIEGQHPVWIKELITA